MSEAHCIAGMQCCFKHTCGACSACTRRQLDVMCLQCDTALAVLSHFLALGVMLVLCDTACNSHLYHALLAIQNVTAYAAVESV